MPAHFDDPSRTADYGYYPHERIEPDEISTDDAVSEIYDALCSNGSAYGKTASELQEWLIDAILTCDKATLEMLKRCEDLDVVRRICDCIANE